jgi:hypothetical protein
MVRSLVLGFILFSITAECSAYTELLTPKRVKCRWGTCGLEISPAYRLATPAERPPSSISF